MFIGRSSKLISIFKTNLNKNKIKSFSTTTKHIISNSNSTGNESNNHLVKLDFSNQSNGICKLTLNNPKKRNALSLDLIRAISGELKTLSERKDIAVVIVAHEGPVFSSGHDLSQLLNASEAQRKQIFDECAKMMLFLREMPQVVIGQVVGAAVAAGFQFISSCDLVVAHEKSTFATPGIKSGLFCTTPGVAVGRAMNSQKKALELLFTGNFINAKEAERYGLINRVVSSTSNETAVQDTEKESLELANQISSLSWDAQKLGKKVMKKKKKKKPCNKIFHF